MLSLLYYAPDHMTNSQCCICQQEIAYEGDRHASERCEQQQVQPGIAEMILRD